MKIIKNALIATAIALAVPAHAEFKMPKCVLIASAAMDAMVLRHKYKDVEEAVSTTNEKYGHSDVLEAIIRDAYVFDPTFRNQPFYSKIQHVVKPFYQKWGDKCRSKTLLSNN